MDRIRAERRPPWCAALIALHKCGEASLSYSIRRLHIAIHAEEGTRLGAAQNRGFEWTSSETRLRKTVEVAAAALLAYVCGELTPQTSRERLGECIRCSVPKRLRVLSPLTPSSHHTVRSHELLRLKGTQPCGGIACDLCGV